MTCSIPHIGLLIVFIPLYLDQAHPTMMIICLVPVLIYIYKEKKKKNKYIHYIYLPLPCMYHIEYIYEHAVQQSTDDSVCIPCTLHALEIQHYNNKPEVTS